MIKTSLARRETGGGRRYELQPPRLLPGQAASLPAALSLLAAPSSCAASIRSISSANRCAARTSSRAKSTAAWSATLPLVVMASADGPPSSDKIGVVPA